MEKSVVAQWPEGCTRPAALDRPLIHAKSDKYTAVGTFMPWKRAPGCATGPLLGDTTLRVPMAPFILADSGEIVNASTSARNGRDGVADSAWRFFRARFRFFRFFHRGFLP